jgi:hypothetical protein
VIALIPFECPQCERGYRVELDFIKMRRLTRVAVCRGCEGRYTLSVRLEKSTGPIEPDPYANERPEEGGPVVHPHSRKKRGRDRRHQATQPDLAPPSQPRGVGSSWPPILSAPPPVTEPPLEDVVDPLLAEDSDPPMHSDPGEVGSDPPPLASLDSDPGPLDPGKSGSALPELELERDPKRHDTEPELPAERDTDPPTSSPALAERRPQRSQSGAVRRTLGGGVRRKGYPGDKAPGVSTHVIVEVGVVGQPTGRRTTKSYRPEHLVTLPGMPSLTPGPKR